LAFVNAARRGMLMVQLSMYLHHAGQVRRSTHRAGFDEAPHYHGHCERLRDRFRDAGADALSDYELLEMVLFRACRVATSSRLQRR
jgi:hypothetical protein